MLEKFSQTVNKYVLQSWFFCWVANLKPVDATHRQTWDTKEFEKKAKERLEKADDEEKSSLGR